MEGKYNKFIILILFMVTIICSNCGISYGFSKVEIFKQLHEIDEFSIEEFAVQGSFYTDGQEKDMFNSIINNIEKEIGKVTLDKKEVNHFNVLFEKGSYEGWIKIFPYKDKNNVILNLSKKGENLDYNYVEKLKDKLEKVLSSINGRVEYSLCVRSKILSNTMEEVKEEVLKEIILNNGKNTEVIPINNGYSIIANLNSKNKKDIFGKEIDFNCAIVKYSSGCYLIMGTPEITLTY